MTNVAQGVEIMAIRSIRVSNFKSFNDLEVELGPFNVLIGANASGKSNFVQVFRFLRDIVDHGLRNAISMQGRIEYLRNIGIGSSKNFSVRVVSDIQVVEVAKAREREQYVALTANEASYEFAISFGGSKGAFEVAKDTLTLRLRCDLVEPQRQEQFERETRHLGPGDITVCSVGGKIKVRSNLPKGAVIEEGNLFWQFLDTEEKLPPGTLLVENPVYLYRFGLGFLRDVSVYDIDPKLPHKAIPIAGRMELEEDGSNLAIVLRSILEDEERRRKFLNLLKDALGFVDSVDVIRFADRSLLLGVRERYTGDAFLPASLLSEGSIRVVTLITVLYFDDNPLMIIEEPERSIHPFLIARVVDMLKEASEKKQIIVTTHNPEVVKHAGLENILLVSRDKEGFSIITRPRDSEEVAVFLRNEIGIEDLFVQDLLRP